MVQLQVNKWLRLVFTLLTIAMVGWAAWTIAGRWSEFRASGASIALRPWPLLLSMVLVLATYALLIEAWRRTVHAWGSELGWGDAARIWFISNLGRYVPGKVWQIGAMGLLAREAGVSPLAATGSSLVINLVNLPAGFAVVAVTGATALDNPKLTLALAGVLTAGMLATPWLLPRFGRVAGAILRRPVELPPLPHAAIWGAAVACVVAWVGYGIAFELLVTALFGVAPGPTSSYIAAFTGSYLLGYIAIFTPGGLGVREQSLVGLLSRLGLAQGGLGGVVVVASRLWLTVLEVGPGALLLAHRTLRRRRSSTPTHVTNA